MQFAFINPESVAAALVEGKSSLVEKFSDQAEVVQELKRLAVKEFGQVYEKAETPNDITDNVLHILWKKLGVTFGVATIVSKPTEEWAVKVQLTPEPIVLVNFWVAPAA